MWPIRLTEEELKKVILILGDTKYNFPLKPS